MTSGESGFFGEDKGLDPDYEALRIPDQADSILARRHFDELWRAAMPYLADEVRANARAQFHQVFWEVYLAATLLKQGAQLVPRAERGPRAPGPDLLQRAPSAYYEAIAVTPGTGIDQVTEARVGEVRDVPDADITLRITAGLIEKVRKYHAYLRDGVVPLDMPYVIAINAGSVPSASKEMDLPRVVRAVLPFGWEVIEADGTGRGTGGRSYQYRPSLVKRSGALVSTRFFEQEETVGISAVLYACVGPFAWPKKGSGFVLVHNPRGVNPLPHGIVPGAWEFWVEDVVLRSTSP